METLPAAAAAVAAPDKRRLYGGRPSQLGRRRRREVLEAFCAAVLPAPRLLEHPLRALLVNPMLAGDAAPWWRLVSMAGGAVGTEKQAGGGGWGGDDAARRRDVAWAVANILRVRLFCFLCVFFFLFIFVIPLDLFFSLAGCRLPCFFVFYGLLCRLFFGSYYRYRCQHRFFSCVCIVVFVSIFICIGEERHGFPLLVVPIYR